ncbi:MAG TPA: DUF4091 domain-containing protein [Bryobacteraceae bacterium]|jgi:hypothetical protein|nr:DUF4091 domain-containing protein [Bryobacteraceae bacterium]
MLRRTLLQLSSLPALVRLGLPDNARPEPSQQANSGVQVWLQSSLQRVFPNSVPGGETECRLLSARNQRVSFQACVRNQTEQRLNVNCEASGPPGISIQVRRVGYVPLPHHTTEVPESDLDGMGCVPGLVPDPLFAEQTASVGPWETQSFWITVRIPADASSGSKQIHLQLTADTEKNKSKLQLEALTAEIDVTSLTIQKRRDFPVTHWWHADAIYIAYKIEPFGDRWWQIAEKYMQNMSSHGSNTMTVPLFHQRKEIIPQPCQLLGVKRTSPDLYEFDWAPVHRFVDLARRNGIEYFEFPHLWLYWEIKNPIHVYQREGNHWTLLWPADAPATTGPFRAFLEQFLPELRRFFTEEKILDRSYFHISDEPSGTAIDNYRKAHALLTELAPWTKGKILDALSDIRYGKEHLVDIPVPLLPAAKNYRDAGIPHWVYFCTVPRGKYLNRLFDTPLAKIRMAGFLFYRLGARGFLHWGYDYWFKMDTQEVPNLFEEGAGYAWPGIPYGDPFVVYPGPDGPLDSIRWEVFAEALDDYALLQTAGVPPDSPLLQEIKDFADFPKSEDWVSKTRARILGKL